MSTGGSWLFFLVSYGDHLDLHSFPTRRSSDLVTWSGDGAAVVLHDTTEVDNAGTFTITGNGNVVRSEEHTSELQSHSEVVCSLLLEKKNNAPFTNNGTVNVQAGTVGVAGGNGA